MDIERARQLCRQYWNPIGVPMKTGSEMDKPYWLPEDEYDSYLRYLISMIVDGADHSQLVQYAGKVERDFLSLSNPKGDKSEFVRCLIAAV